MSSYDAAAYSAVKDRYTSLPAFQPLIPTSALPYLAFIFLVTSFILAFYFSTLPKNGLASREIPVALLASVLGGFGVVALFNSVGVYV